MPFFANKFSTILTGLLTALNLMAQGENKSLKLNNLKKEVPVSPSRNEIAEKDRWNVEAMYHNPENWKKEFTEMKSLTQWVSLSAFKDQLHDPNAVEQLLRGYFGQLRELDKLHTYAHLRHDEDLGNDYFKSEFGLISNLRHEFALEMSWIEPRLIALSDEAFQGLVTSDVLKPYAFYLEKIERMRSHTLTQEQESLI